MPRSQDRAPAPQPSAPPAKAPAPVAKAVQLGDEWADLLSSLSLDGPIRNFARNSALESRQEDVWTLAISPRFEALYKDENRAVLEQALSEKLGKPVTIKVSIEEPTKSTPDQLLAQYKEARKREAVDMLQADDFVLALQQQFGASLDLGSVTPIDE